MSGLNLTLEKYHVVEEIEAIIDKKAEELAYRIPEESRKLMDSSTPRGKIYRRGGIRGPIRKGLRPVPGTRTRGYVGTRFHRASAAGQPPAEDTGNLYRDITVRKVGKGVYRVRFGAKYAGYLEFTLDRPFILPAVDEAVRKTFRNL